MVSTIIIVYVDSFSSHFGHLVYHIATLLSNNIKCTIVQSSKLSDSWSCYKDLKNKFWWYSLLVNSLFHQYSKWYAVYYYFEMHQSVQHYTPFHWCIMQCIHLFHVSEISFDLTFWNIFWFGDNKCALRHSLLWWQTPGIMENILAGYRPTTWVQWMYFRKWYSSTLNFVSKLKTTQRKKYLLRYTIVQCRNLI